MHGFVLKNFFLISIKQKIRPSYTDAKEITKCSKMRNAVTPTNLVPYKLRLLKKETVTQSYLKSKVLKQ
jgi:hypothetical protein